MRPRCRQAPQISESEAGDLRYGVRRGRGGIRKNTKLLGAIDWFSTLSRNQGLPSAVADIRYRPWQGTSGGLLLIVLDSSGSTLKNQGLSAAKGVVASVIQAAYAMRLRVGMLQFAGNGVRLSIPPRRAPMQTIELMQGITGGGGTPLRRAIEEAIRVLEREHRRFPEEQQALLLLTDGRSRDDIRDIQIPCRALVIDTETGPIRLGHCRRLANELKGDYFTLDDLPVRERASK